MSMIVFTVVVRQKQRARRPSTAPTITILVHVIVLVRRVATREPAFRVVSVDGKHLSRRSHEESDTILL